MMGKKIEITYKIITPMFLAGANNSDKAELRPPSIKGALRFWYRAIDAEFRKHEKRIFGSSDKGFGQSLFLVKIIKNKTKSANATNVNGYNYLAYGVSGANARHYLKHNGTFILQLLFKPSASEADIARVKRSLWAMTMFGGLGSRSRKGFGSIIATETSGMEELPTLCPTNRDELKTNIEAFVSSSIILNTARLPEHSCWSPQTRCVIFGRDTLNSGTTALQELQNTIFKYRSSQSNECFWWAIDDKDQLRDFAQNENAPEAPPERAAFGLPHNYYFGDLRGRKYVDVNLMDGNTVSRRGSPLFFKVHQFSNGSTCIIATFLKSRFIPVNETINITSYEKTNDGNKIDKISVDLPSTSTNNYQAIEDLLNKFSDALLHNGMEIKK